MRRLFNNEGNLFGYEKDKYLYYYDGTCVGKFELDLIYDKDGNYLGEITSLGVLARHRFKTNQHINTWSHPNGTAIDFCKTAPVLNFATSHSQYESFPSINYFK